MTLPVQVLPDWYQTLAFRIALTLAGIARSLRRWSRAERCICAATSAIWNARWCERTAELRESQRQLEQIAYEDTLTALPNRRMFTEEFRELIMLARLQNQRFALLLIDLDRFKQINDSLRPRCRRCAAHRSGNPPAGGRAQVRLRRAAGRR